jgi:holliday junction DNA helicase RuvA
MIGQLTGTITTTRRNPLIIDVHGVGYLVHVTEKLLSSLPSGTQSTIYIHTHVREEALDLYGFANEQELALFALLLTVSGIGPKTALLVADRGAEPIYRAVRDADVDFFTSIPRLGRKNAQKIIIELKNKLKDAKELDLSGSTSTNTKQLTEALLSMGFKRHEVAHALETIDLSVGTMENHMRTLLKLLGK